MLTGMQHEESAEKIVLSTTLSNTSIGKQNCYKIGNIVHIYARFEFSGNVSISATTDLVSGLPAPKSVANVDNGFGLVTGTAGGSFGSANAYVIGNGLRQSFSSSFISGDKICISIDYYI